jgi:hypothetical protein
MYQENWWQFRRVGEFYGRGAVRRSVKSPLDDFYKSLFEMLGQQAN